MSFRARLHEASAQAPSAAPPTDPVAARVEQALALAAQPARLYRFQSPCTFAFGGVPVLPGRAARRVHRCGNDDNDDDDEQTADTGQREASAPDERDAELLRMIQRASRRPRFNVDRTRAAPDDEPLLRHMRNAEDAIAFFAAHGSRTHVKYVLLNAAPPQLHFRPYDLDVVPRGREHAEHYIMSASGIVHLCPGRPSEVISLADWARESSLFNVLRKIPFFARYLLHKAFVRLHAATRARQYAATRRALAGGWLLAKQTFAQPCLELHNAAHDLAVTTTIAYDAQGKHDYTVDDFAAQQARQRQLAANALAATMERVESRLARLMDALQRNVNVPNLNTREALEQYLLANARSSSSSSDKTASAAGGGAAYAHARRKTQSMLEAKADVLRRMRELKRSIVEYTLLDVFVRLCDSMTAERLFAGALTAMQTLYNTLRAQEHEERWRIGFQVLLQPSATTWLLNPSEAAVHAVFVDVLDGCVDTAASPLRLCEIKFFKAYFVRAPRVWAIASELRADVRVRFLRDSVLRLVHDDYVQANTRVSSYVTALPYIHFLTQPWAELERAMLRDANATTLTCALMAQVYQRIAEAQAALRVLITSFVGHTLWINAAKQKAEVEPHMHALRVSADAALRATTHNAIGALNAYFKQKTMVLGTRPAGLDEFADYVAEYKSIVAAQATTEAAVVQAETLCELMERQQVEFTDDEDRQLKERTLGSGAGAAAASLHVLFDEARMRAEEFIEEHMPAHIDLLRSEAALVEDECLSLQQLLLGDEFATLADRAEPTLLYLDDVAVKLCDVEARAQRLARFAALFDVPPAVDAACVRDVRALYEARRELWSLLQLLHERLAHWLDCPVAHLDAAAMEEQVQQMLRRATAVAGIVQEHEYEDDVGPHVIAELQAVRQRMSVIHDCCNPHLTHEHWAVVLQAAAVAAAGGTPVAASSSSSSSSGTTAAAASTHSRANSSKAAGAVGDGYHDELTLRALQERNVFAVSNVLAEQSGLATGEWKISSDLDEMARVWDGVLFVTKPHQTRAGVRILDALDDVTQQLDDHQLELQTMMASRFLAPVRERVEHWVHSLRRVASVLEEWVALQKSWLYLEFIFASDDIKEQLPDESAQFDAIDRLFRDLTSRASTTRNVLRICTDDDVLERLQASNAAMDVIQKRLEQYLETKRAAFPRFYFLSNDELLSILSDVRNPQAVQPHLSKCFDNMAALCFAEDESAEAVGMRSAEGEEVLFDAPVYAVGGIEQWLTEVELAMRTSLMSHMRRTIDAHAQHTAREQWLFSHPAQCVQAVDMVAWTSEVEVAIAESDLPTYHSQYQQQLLRLVQLVKTPLATLQRALVCTLIVLNVHNRDMVHELCDEHVTHRGDFAWTRQLRYYWESNETRSSSSSSSSSGVANGDDDDNNNNNNNNKNDNHGNDDDDGDKGGDGATHGAAGRVSIRHGDAHLWYGYEYLGNQPRLVITPLTDRAFLTCTSALAVNLGAAPQGPAGTGKTESVKDLGKALARQVVVFNCSDGINYKTMSRMFAGLAQAGAWACFDEFNRIELEVLSVVAQQMLEITTALREHQTRMTFDGRAIQLSSNFGVFITMNPGYAGRTELPDNLKALFRPICMMIPDYALIAEIMFYSEGFSDARTLARKMVQLYKLSSEQLSKQDHYDFGMRAVKSILVLAGALKRQHPDESEDVLLIRAMRDSNVPKFLRDDTVLFMALVRDLFPGVAVAEHTSTLLRDYLARDLVDAGLVAVPGLITKALQLFDTLTVRHGIMLVGQTLSGKTTVLRTTQRALTALKADGHGDGGGHDNNNDDDDDSSGGQDGTRDATASSPLYNTVHTYLLNPKSVSMGELYGHVNDVTREWSDGILSDVARHVVRAAHGSADRHWVVFDGPVDALWIENMNTVLDDNKMLCLFNGERIKLPATATFLFEVQDLKVASPATVSRCGMVYLEPHYLDGERGWRPLVRSLVARTAAANAALRGGERLLQLLDAVLPETLGFVRTHCHEWVASVDAQLAMNCVTLLDALLRTSEREAHAASASDTDDSGGGERLWPREAVCAPHKEDDDSNNNNNDKTTATTATTATTTTTTTSERLFDLYFVMAVVWAVGGNVRDDAREAFSTHLKSLLRRVLPTAMDAAVLPPGGVSMYDCVVHRPTCRFVTWASLVPAYVFDAQTPYFDRIVPTSESLALATLLGVLTTSAQHVLVNGVTGTGKTTSIAALLRDRLRGDDPAAAWEYVATTFSAQTRSRDVVERLQSKLYKVRSHVLGPTPGKRATVLFVDDVNMPALERYGASPPLELLRQLMTQRGFYDTYKKPATFTEVHEVVLLAACGVPGGGRNAMPPRLTSRFCLLCQPAVSTASMRRIFGSILHGFLRAWHNDDVFAPLATRLVDATRECYQCIVREKLPTPTRSHYTFNLRDFSKVIQGIMQVTPHSAPTPAALCRVFVHEVTRTFHDRLVDAGDRRWWWTTLARVCSTTLHFPWRARYERLLFGDYMRRDRAVYAEVTADGDHDDDDVNNDDDNNNNNNDDDNNNNNEDDDDDAAAGEAYLARVHDVLMDYQNAHNLEHNTDTHLVLFPDAIAHVSRICRILRQPRGHALLVGMGGTGRQSLCKLAAFICDLPVHEVAVTRGFTLATFRERLKAVLLECGCRGKPAVFLLSDAQLVHEAMLEDVNNLLNSGEVPNLMLSEDVDQIVDAVRPLATAAGKSDTRSVVVGHFVALCRDLLHVVLALSPVGEAFRRRLRTFPSLVNCCTIDWFDQWPADALRAVAARVLRDLPGVDAATTSQLTRLCVSLHLDVQARSDEFYDELRRRNYTTPTSYLELLTCYRTLLQAQQQRSAEQLRRYQGGLDTLRTTQQTVDEMKVKLVELQPRLLQAAKETEEIMAKVVQEQEAAEVVRAQCAREEEVAAGVQAEADGIRGECRAELDKALPILQAAEDALAELRPDDIREVRSFQKPAARVVLVLEAVLTLLGERDVSWERAKLVMSRMDFIKDLQNYKRDELTEKTIRAIQKYVHNADFQPDEVAKSSKACKSLAMWVLAIHNYYEVVKVVAPKRQRLAEAEAKLAAATRVLHDARGFLQQIEDKLTQLRTQMHDNAAKKKQLEDDIALTTVRLQRAEQLMSGLSSEQARWTDTVATLRAEQRTNVGKTALAAAFVAYLGPFTAPYRARMLADWHAKCVDLHIPVDAAGFRLDSVMDPVQVQSWLQQGLPPDPFSVENGVVVSLSRRWCLCIDPQGQAVNWIRAAERERNLRVVRLSDGSNYMRTLENAIRVGLPVLIENVEETLDAALDAVLLRQTRRVQGRQLIRLGDTEVDYDPNFRLYLATSRPNPHYLPELQIKVTIVNFTVTSAGLENQLLANVVGFEYAELEQRANRTVLDIAHGKSELRQLENRTLQLLAASTGGTILDNEQLVHALQSAKTTSEAVAEALRVAEDTQRDIDTARNRYRPVATRGATLYAVLSQLSGLDHMYHHSLGFFKQLFAQTLQRTERVDHVAERVALLLPALTLRTYRTACRGLFEKDKLTFAFLLYVHLAQQQGTMRDEEWAFLLKGSEGRRFVDEDVDPAPAWLPPARWNELAALASRVPALAAVREDVYVHEAEWEAWYGRDDAHVAYPAALAELTAWQRVLVLKAMREDLLRYALPGLVASALGEAFVDSVAFDLDAAFADSTAASPIVFVLTAGADPTQLFIDFAERMGYAARKHMLSLGQDQGAKAEALLHTARRDGAWVYLQNCHVYTSWMPTLEQLCESLAHGDVHDDFRLWLTTMPTAHFPVPVLQAGVKLVKEAPKGMKANLRDTLTTALTPDVWDARPRNARVWRRLLYALTTFHAVLQERRQYGPLGWNIPYEWNHADFAASLHSLDAYVAVDGARNGSSSNNNNDHHGTHHHNNDDDDDASERSGHVASDLTAAAGASGGGVAWSALRYMVGVIHYGGRVTDFLDQRCLLTLYDRIVAGALATPTEAASSQQAATTAAATRTAVTGSRAAACASHGDVYTMPDDLSSLDAVQQYVQQRLPAFDPPDVFGLHHNADVMYNRMTVRQQLAAMLSVQPRSKAVAGGRSAEDTLLDMVDEFARRLPAPIDKSRAHRDTYRVSDVDGTMVSLGTVAAQEVDVYNGILHKLRHTLQQLRAALRGEVVVSLELEVMLDAMLLGHVPAAWHEGSYLSRKPLASWFDDTVQRIEFFREWNDHGAPSSYWISGFYFPQGFLTGVLQTYSRARTLPIDEVTLSTHVTGYELPEDIDDDVDDGVYVHGLYLEGASYDMVHHSLAESRKGELYTRMPVIHLRPVSRHAADRSSSSSGGKATSHETPSCAGEMLDYLASASVSTMLTASMTALTAGTSAAPATTALYSCPLYKTSARAGALSTTGLSTNYVVSLDLHSGTSTPPEHWVERGVALLCMLDD